MNINNNNTRTQELASFLHGWIKQNTNWARDKSTLPPRLRTAREIANDLAPSIERGDVHIAQWFESPDGELISNAVALALPPPGGLEVQLLKDAVLIAAQEQNRNQKIVFGVLALALASVLASVIFIVAGKTLPSSR